MEEKVVAGICSFVEVIAVERPVDTAVLVGAATEF